MSCAISLAAPLLKTTFAPASVAARTEKRLVGKSGASSAFFRITLAVLPRESMSVSLALPLAMAKLLLRRPLATSI